MTLPTHLNVAGAGRGALDFTEVAEGHGLLKRLHAVDIVDPTPGKANLLAPRYRSGGASVRTFDSPFEDVLDRVHPEAPTAVLVDNPRSAAAAARGRPTTHSVVQLVSQPTSQGQHRGAQLSFASLLSPDRPEERRVAQELLDRFTALSPVRRSSALIRADGLAAFEFAHSRREATKRTVARLLDIDRGASQTHLSELVWRGSPWPVRIAQSGETRPDRQRQQAYALAGGSRIAAALFRPDGGITFVMVDIGYGSRPMARAWFQFDPPPPPPPVERSSRRRDGAFVGAAAALLFGD